MRHVLEPLPVLPGQGGHLPHRVDRPRLGHQVSRQCHSKSEIQHFHILTFSKFKHLFFVHTVNLVFKIFSFNPISIETLMLFIPVNFILLIIETCSSFMRNNNSPTIQRTFFQSLQLFFGKFFICYASKKVRKL